MITDKLISRRTFVKATGLGAAALGLSSCSVYKNAPSGVAQNNAQNVIQGFEDKGKDDLHTGWVPVSDRKVKVGIAGNGYCHFGGEFGFQDHPNVEVVAVTDLIPERCDSLAKKCRCAKKYPSLEEMVKDPAIEAVFVATDAPSHFKHVMLCLEHGKHVACAVPAVFGTVEDAFRLFEKVKETGLTYMMFETSMFHADLHEARMLYEAGKLGKIIYAEGEYFHYGCHVLDSYKAWRIGLPPLWYPTHATAYYVGVTGGSFSEVSCMGVKSTLEKLKGDNAYANPFGTEIALYRTFDGGTARMGVSWDTPGWGGEKGRVRGQLGGVFKHFTTEGDFEFDPSSINIKRPPLPDGMEAGGHGGSHGLLTDEFITSILEERKPLVDIAKALNMTVPGIVAHQSALRDGELMKIPQFTF